MGGGAFQTVIQVAASLSALYMCFSPSTDLYRIHKRQDVGEATVLPLAALWVCNHMWYVRIYVFGAASTSHQGPHHVVYCAA